MNTTRAQLAIRHHPSAGWKDKDTSSTGSRRTEVAKTSTGLIEAIDSVYRQLFDGNMRAPALLHTRQAQLTVRWIPPLSSSPMCCPLWR